MKERLWRFSDNLGSFESKKAAQIKSLYFPLANERLMSSLTPDLHGDIKSGQNSFLLTPVSRIDLVTSRASRNFWIYFGRNKYWSATGVSKNLKQMQNDRFFQEAGLLWHKITRENKEVGLKSEILSFIPASGEPVEIMQVKISNISSRPQEFVPTAAIPIYGRSANSLRDHRHVTSLLQRVNLHKFGVVVKPTLLFDETGHSPNKDIYFVLGWDEKSNPPQYLYPTQEMFCGDEGDLEAPVSILENTLPAKRDIQGRETMGALRFKKINLTPSKSHSYIILMGITEDSAELKKIIIKFSSLDKVGASLKETKNFWINKGKQINLATGDPDFDNWFRWVSIQPALRRIFGCSFLPDFDYGKGGRGWRDLWQDCLELILNDPKRISKLLVSNFSGIRIDGSNATIIGKKPGEFTPLEIRRRRRLTAASGNLSLTGFIADRNDIARVWMDHGVWPLLTLDLYINETGDLEILFEETTYFRDQHIFRARFCDKDWNQSEGNILRSASGEIYQGSIIEHLLVQNLVQFFNVGSHNYVRLEGADWNDGLDMARERGESVAFSAVYASNLKLLSELLLKIGKREIKIAQELKILLREIDYNNVKAKQKVLNEYFIETKEAFSGKKVDLDVAGLADNLEKKSLWMVNHIHKSEWLKSGFFNGYYDNNGKRVEGIKNNLVRMILSSQVFPIMGGVTEGRQIDKIIKNVEKYLFDTKCKGFRLNTDFKEEQHNLGRAFSFIYGDKENGAFFNHMVVIFAYALYKQGYAEAGWRALNSIYNMAVDTGKSKIYPCLAEYFNLEGRGMYSYLTGSASWFVLTMVTQCFGVRGKDGDLLIEPKLSAGQFRKSSIVSINRNFAGRKLKIDFSNPKRLNPYRYNIIKAILNSRDLNLKKAKSILIERKTILNLPQDKINTLHLTLG
jgi:cellobiose phosphorylase